MIDGLKSPFFARMHYNPLMHSILHCWHGDKIICHDVVTSRQRRLNKHYIHFLQFHSDRKWKLKTELPRTIIRSLLHCVLRCRMSLVCCWKIALTNKPTTLIACDDTWLVVRYRHAYNENNLTDWEKFQLCMFQSERGGVLWRRCWRQHTGQVCCEYTVLSA